MEKYIMKKQIIAAAVAASVSAVALADVSISGAAQVNINKTLDTAGQPTVTHDVDIKVTGKTGGTTFVVDLENTSKTGELSNVGTPETQALTDEAPAVALTSTGITAAGNALQVKNVYMTTDLAGITVKAGEWYNGDSNLNDASLQKPRAELSTTLGSVSAKFAMEPSSGTPRLSGTDGLYEIHLGADLAGVKVNYEQENQDSHKIISVGGSLAGVDFSYTDSRSDNTGGDRLDTAAAAAQNVVSSTEAAAWDGVDTNNEQNIAIATNVGGMKVEYQKMKSKAGTTSDGFFGEFTSANLLEADGFGLTTSLAGNTVQIRNYKTVTENLTKGSGNTATLVEDGDTVTAPTKNRDTKIIVTRPLASGATAEFTYVTGDSTNSMDLEFRMKF
jgi:hypothetical protein